MRKICVLLIFCSVGIFSTNNISAKNSAKEDSFKNLGSKQIDCIAAFLLWCDSAAGYGYAPAGSVQEAQYFLMMGFYAGVMDQYCAV